MVRRTPGAGHDLAGANSTGQVPAGSLVQINTPADLLACDWCDRELVCRVLAEADEVGTVPPESLHHVITKCELGRVRPGEVAPAHGSIDPPRWRTRHAQRQLG